MRRELQGVTAVVMFAFAGGNAFAAPAGGDFYQNMLRRGVASYSAGRPDAAARELRIAAFGLVDTIDRFQTAHVYLALASDRLGNQPDARYSALRILTAERIERHYAALDLPQAVRAAFEVVAAKVLTPDQLATLRAPVPPAQITANDPAATATANPAPVPQPRRPAPNPQPRTPAPVPQPSTRPATPVPQTPAPRTQAPAPQPAPVTPAPVQQPRVQPPTPAPKPAPLPPRTATVETPAVRIATITETNAAIASADRSLMAGKLSEARVAYVTALDHAPSDHDLLIRLAEGLYRSRDFHGVLRAFNRLGALRRGEDPYRYYLAVALYETGNYSGAKRELKSALPFIEETPDVVRYRAKIESAID